MVEIGDIFYSSWGYEQTNVDFYQVIALKGKQTVIIQEIKQRVVETTGFMSETVAPIPGEFKESEPPIQKRLSKSGSLSLSSYSNAYIWDGKPKYQSHYA